MPACVLSAALVRRQRHADDLRACSAAQASDWADPVVNVIMHVLSTLKA
jgi:hypothetical protein